MYRYVEDKKLISSMRQLCGDIMQDLCHQLKIDYDIGARFYMVGSGARNLILQNANEPIDLDYNLEIVRCEDYEECGMIKENVRKSFNKVLKMYDIGDCDDSTSALTTEKRYFTNINNETEFYMDVSIVCRDEDGIYYRLIHKKTGWIQNDEYTWDEAPRSKNFRKKVQKIKNVGAWYLVRDQYLNLKNVYLTRNDRNHPSFICYVEAVNNVYNDCKQQMTKSHSNVI